KSMRAMETIRTQLRREKTFSGGEFMTIQDREKRVRRILRKQGKRLIKSRERQALYTVMSGSVTECETEFLDSVEWAAVIADRTITRQIGLERGKVPRHMLEAALDKLDK